MGCDPTIGTGAPPALETQTAGAVTLPGTALQDGVPVTVSGAAASVTYFYVNLPAGLQEVSFALTGGTGNANMTIKSGQVPTNSVNDCNPRGSDNEEKCNVQAPAADTWSVKLEGMTAYANAKLVVYFNQPLPLFANTNFFHYSNKPTMFFVDVPAGKGRFKIDSSGTSTVKARLGARPTDTLFDCSGTCDIFKPRAGRYYILMSNNTSGNQILPWVTGSVKPTVALTNGQTVTGISAARDDLTYYTLSVPTGQARLSVEVSSVIRSLYVQRGDPFPGVNGTAVDCLASVSSGPASCTFDNPQAGTWYLVVRANSAIYSLNLTARVVSSTGTGTATPLQNYQQVSGLSGSPLEDRYYSLTVPEGKPSLDVRATQGTGLAEVFVQQGTPPKRGEGTACGTGCKFQNPTPGTWYILVRGYTTFSGLSFSAGCPNVLTLAPGQPVLYGGSSAYYSFDIPEGQTEANFTLTTEHNNWAMVKQGSWSTNVSDGCRSPCRLFRPQAGRYYVTVYFTTGIVYGTLAGWYGGGPVGSLTEGVPEAFTAGAQREFRYWRIDVPEGQAQLRVDHAFQRGTQTRLYVRYGDVPATFQYTCQATSWTYNNVPPGQTCVIDNPQAGAWYVLVASESALDGVVRATTSSGIPLMAPGFEEQPFAGAPGLERVWKVEVPAGLSDFRVVLSGGTGNADLYVKHGEVPGTTYDCASTRPNNEEHCEFANPQPGTWYVAVRGTEAFTNARLVTTFASTPGEGVRALASGENVVAFEGKSGSVQYFKVEVPEGKNRLVVGMSGGRGNADLAVSRGVRPTLTAADCRSQSLTSLDVCVFENPVPGTWLIRVDGATDFKDVVLTARYSVTNEIIPMTLGTPVPNLYLGPSEALVFSVTIASSSDFVRLDVQSGVNPATDVRFADMSYNNVFTCNTSGRFTQCLDSFNSSSPGQRRISVKSKTPATASWGNMVTINDGIDGWNDDTTFASLMNGVAATELTGNGQFKIEVPSGATKLTITTRGPTGTSSDPGQLSLYVKGLKPASSSQYTCASTATGISQGCSWTTPTAGTWYLATYWTSGSYDVKATFE
ncbi:PPC domain-containing protein [Pyxidicoccus trucidator]|uniref:PPC domain-containing protein n=1 Tax=Pyxidicoccus trucidator TaxID=2709662 RepID=UPI0013DB32CF|nr:PPC domain-containing protein [Pyxidicoccus trucidator]